MKKFAVIFVAIIVMMMGIAGCSPSKEDIINTIKPDIQKQAENIPGIMMLSNTGVKPEVGNFKLIEVDPNHYEGTFDLILSKPSLDPKYNLIIPLDIEIKTDSDSVAWQIPAFSNDFILQMELEDAIKKKMIGG